MFRGVTPLMRHDGLIGKQGSGVQGFGCSITSNLSEVPEPEPQGSRGGNFHALTLPPAPYPMNPFFNSSFCHTPRH